MIKVLTITGILPIPDIQKKAMENDILLISEEHVTNRYKGIEFIYLFTLPFVIKPLSWLSQKWFTYYKLKNEKKYNLRGRQLYIIGVILLPFNLYINELLYKLSFWLNRKHIDEIIKETSPTIIHAHNVHSDGYYARRISEKYNIPYIISLRGLFLSSSKLVKVNLENAKFLVAISPKQKEDTKRIINRDVLLIPHGVDEHFFIGEKSAERSCPFKIVVVSRLIRLKNIDKVIQALSNVQEDFIFDIYGDGPEKMALLSLIQSLGLSKKIQLKGYIRNEELPKILKDYDLFVMVSYPETLGRVYLEAMACGLPIISAKNTGIDGLITNGNEGFLIDHNDISSLYLKIQYLINTPDVLQKMSINAQAFSKGFNWNKTAEKLFNLYQ